VKPVPLVSVFEILSQHHVDVGEGHRLWVDHAGDPLGVPAVWVHGGPGSGFGDNALELFNPDTHRVVRYDQRGAGRSTPFAADDLNWSTIDMNRHIDDLETIRRSLGIDRWIVSGASWGSVLSLTYAQRHPDRVIGVVVAAVSTGGRSEIDHLTEGGHRYAPEPWQRFNDYASRHHPDVRLVEAYRRLVMDPDPHVHTPAALEWCRWEDAHVNVDDNELIEGFADPRYRNPTTRLAFARQVTHCWAADSWLRPDELIDGAAKMGTTPCVLIHGRRDVSTTTASAQALNDAWPGSRLILTDDGHGGHEMWTQAAAALLEFASRTSG
jgi:proline iminopeptidase